MAKNSVRFPNASVFVEKAIRPTKCRHCPRVIKPGQTRITVVTPSGYPRSACAKCALKATKRLLKLLEG